MTINGVTAAGGNSFGGAEAPGVTKSITSFGAYTVTESTVAGYEQTSASADCTGTIALGQTKTCTITNDDKAATLTVIKHVVNDNGGTRSRGRIHDDDQRRDRLGRQLLRRSREPRASTRR